MSKRAFLLFCVLFQVLAIFVFMQYRNRLVTVSPPFADEIKDRENQFSDSAGTFTVSDKPRKQQPHYDIKKEGKKVDTDKCGYAACHPTDAEALNVHIVAHSHDDVGWLKTVEEYYYGKKEEIQKASVQKIINSVMKALEDDPKRKFIQVESAYLAMWWKEYQEEDHIRLQKLINNGQIEIIGGAWTMNDEACTYYQSIIDQFTSGLKFLDDKLGPCARPKIGWQIDPFGHSREMASIFAQLGYDGYLLARTDYRDKNARLNTQTAEMIWQGSSSLGKDSWMFTHVLYNHYQAPIGFYFDVLSTDDPLVADKLSSQYNLPEKMQVFTQFVSKQAEKYATNNIILTMGMDFAYQNATYNYNNLDTLIKAYEDKEEHDSKGRRIKLFYSTPSCYIKAVNDYSTKNEVAFAVKTDDFFPYSDKMDRYWTGYFSSRPNLKRLERQGNNILQIAKQLAVFNGSLTNGYSKPLEELISAMGIMQHHDAVTGTEKQEVAKDYIKILTKAIDNIHADITEVLHKLLAKTLKNQDLLDIHFQSCILSNISVCPPAQSDAFVVAVYNPLSYSTSFPVRIPVESNRFIIVGPKGNVKWQLLPAMDSFSYVENLKPAKYELVFLATDLPPLGTIAYYIVDDGYEDKPDIVPTDKDRFTLGDTNLGFTISEKTGLLESITVDGQKLQITQELMYYRSGFGSGAYVFKPEREAKANRFIKDSLTSFKVYKGDIVDEVHQTFGNWCKQIIRVYNAPENHIEFDWLVGPIDISDGTAKEVISRFVTNLNTSQEFYTDSNGREFLKRRVNFRATYEFDADQPIAGNYYPVNSGISIVNKEEDIEVAVITDRAQGGTSLRSGEIELMVHRRLLNDDGLGVDEALNETEFKGNGTVARGQHYLTFGSAGDGSTRRRLKEISQKQLHSPWLFIGETQNKLDELDDKIYYKYSGVKKHLMPDTQVHILTLEPWHSEKGNQVLLRIEHYIEISEGGKDVMIDLTNYFNEFKIVGMRETTLAGNQMLSENERLLWKANKCLASLETCRSDKLPSTSFKHKHLDKGLSRLQLLLTPMEIRTFIMTVNYL